MSIQELEDAARTASPDELRRMLRVIQARLAETSGGDGAPAPLDDAEGKSGVRTEFESVPFERIAHLAGIVKGGPPDLASNKDYLKGLGDRSMS